MSRLKALARDWLPPALVRALAPATPLTFTGDFASWPQAVAQSVGYDHALILERVLAATLKVKSGEAAYERDSVLFQRIDYVWPVTTALLWAAARNAGELRVLDFGGSLGSTYFQNRALIDPLPLVRWGVVEQPAFVAAGRKHVADDRLSFHDAIDACVAHARPGVVLLSSVLQYLEDPYAVLRSLAAVGACVIVIDRTPISDDGQQRIVIQHVPPSIYPASYPMRILSMSAVLAALGPGWRLTASVTAPEGQAHVPGLRFSFMGMILESTRDAIR